MKDTELHDQASSNEGARVDGATADVGGTAAPAVDSPEELQKRIDSLEDSLLRTKAEHQNIMRRAATERADALRYAHADIMRTIIPILDDLDRAIEAGADKKGSAGVGGLLDGVKLVRENLLKALREQGLEIIEAADRPFDPHVHEAMLQQPSDEHPAGTVLQELARGYRLRDRTLRPAKVIVSKGNAS